MEDLDGDGRGDLYFLDPEGTLTVHLGGERGALSDAELIYWFYEGHDRHWEPGAGCPSDPGAAFGEIAVAVTTLGPAALYPDPAGSGWALGGLLPDGEPWTVAVSGEGLDLAVVATPAGERLAVLHAGTADMVSLFTPAGRPTGRVRFGALEGPDGPGRPGSGRRPRPRGGGRRGPGGV